MNKEEFISYCKELGLTINEEILLKLDSYFELLREWNEKFNLTRIIEEKEVYLKHFYDSIYLFNTGLLKDENIKLCDFGTGAGFPGIVIKIFFNNIDVTLIESSNKKCLFLNEVINKLGLSDIKVVNERAEIYARSNREKFDVVTCRAVSALRIIEELALPMVKIGGYFLPLKSGLEEEYKEAKDSLDHLGGIVKKIISYNLPIEEAKRNIVVIKKISPTEAKYPRDYKDILKHLK